MEEFQEADILWPDTAALSSREAARFFFVVPPSEMCYEVAAPAVCCCSVSSGTAGCSESEGFLSGAPAPSTAGASTDGDVKIDEEELREVEVLWPDTAQPDERPPADARGCYGWFCGDLGPDGGRHAKPPSGWRRRRPAASSPIDIPAKVTALHRVFGDARETGGCLEAAESHRRGPGRCRGALLPKTEAADRHMQIFWSVYILVITSARKHLSKTDLAVPTEGVHLPLSFEPRTSKGKASGVGNKYKQTEKRARKGSQISPSKNIL
ncbi:hypothetical protein GUJ93_ZPchr0001g31503 [Zizania palustris]|uniref:Uncharacterized protein n=1 Tax=Zizania palustris TaxID=103762 RepID=A0A8J5RZZ9_ZIZPA|nr:hypothetical protein GUJ93_ZPchr0001g31503 [Zizania palustris]